VGGRDRPPTGLSLDTRSNPLDGSTAVIESAQSANVAGVSPSAHLQKLEAESIHILREVVAELDNPVLLYSIGKDSSVILHLALKAFYPSKPPFPLLHIDSTWEFREMIEFREQYARHKLGLNVIAYANEEGVADGVNPFDHGSKVYTDVMRTQPLKQALTKHGFDGAIGGGRRDEERSRAKERVFSFRDRHHRWDPRNQRPELWNLYNTWKKSAECLRVFPLSNWTELVVWQCSCPFYAQVRTD